jgi:hypothetical protein
LDLASLKHTYWSFSHASNSCTCRCALRVTRIRCIHPHLLFPQRSIIGGYYHLLHSPVQSRRERDGIRKSSLLPNIIEDLVLKFVVCWFRADVSKLKIFWSGLLPMIVTRGLGYHYFFLLDFPLPLFTLYHTMSLRY